MNRRVDIYRAISATHRKGAWPAHHDASCRPYLAAGEGWLLPSRIQVLRGEIWIEARQHAAGSVLAESGTPAILPGGKVGLEEDARKLSDGPDRSVRKYSHSDGRLGKLL